VSAAAGHQVACLVDVRDQHRSAAGVVEDDDGIPEHGDAVEGRYPAALIVSAPLTWS
jgi:hypothetical protein